jgi:hypothetical protein
MAAATTTLSTTTLASQCDFDALQVKVASVTGLAAGMRLYVDRESMAVVSITSLSDALGTVVNIRRGQDGTNTSAHAAGATVVLAQPNQLYASDPVGLPPENALVSPYINLKTGVYWYAVGDDGPNAVRWWQQQTTTYSIGSTGQRVVTQLLPENTAP